MATKSKTIHPIYPEGKDCGEPGRDRVMKVAAESYRSISRSFSEQSKLHSSTSPLYTLIHTQICFPAFGSAKNTESF